MIPRLPVFAVLVIFALAAPATALLIPTVDSRFLAAHYYTVCAGCGPNGEDLYDVHEDLAFPDAADFSTDVQAGSWFASQTSSVGAERLLARGSSTMGAEGLEGQATSVYEVAFEVDVPTRFELTGVLTNASHNAILDLLVMEGTTRLVLHLFDATGGFGVVPVELAGVLAPGSYALRARAKHQTFSGAIPGDSVAFDFSLRTIPVPEPGVLFLLGVGVVGLAWWRR